jgi:hypothetical protein
VAGISSDVEDICGVVVLFSGGKESGCAMN